MLKSHFKFPVSASPHSVQHPSSDLAYGSATFSLKGSRESA